MMRIIYDEEYSPEKKLQDCFLQAAALALAREGIEAEQCEISLSFLARDEMRALNAKHRGKDAPTDVLSFPMYIGADEIREMAAGAPAPVLLGDVVICIEAAERQAKEIGQGLDRELAYLFVHSVFHLLGYIHEDEASRARMREAEEETLSHLSGLFER